MKAFLHHLAHEFETVIRDKPKLLLFYLFPLVFFALVGGFMTTVNPFFKESMLSAMLLFAFISAALLSYLAMAGFGVLIGVAAGNMNVSMLLGQLISIPSTILGGSMVPADMFPWLSREPPS